MRARLIAAARALMLTAVVADAAVLTPAHVVIVIEENLPTRELAPELAYLNSLLHQGANFTNSHGIDHPSQPNYLALFSGDPQGTGSDAKRNPDGSNPIAMATPRSAPTTHCSTPRSTRPISGPR